jgi:hypothetical protein
MVVMIRYELDDGVLIVSPAPVQPAPARCHPADGHSQRGLPGGA